MSMLKILQMANSIGGNPNTKINTRKEMTVFIKEKYPELYDDYQEAWKYGYMRQGRLFGIVLTKNGFNKMIKLKEY